MKTTFCDLSVERVTEGVREKKREKTSGETLQTLSSQSYIRIQQKQNMKPNIEEQIVSAVKLEIGDSDYIYPLGFHSIYCCRCFETNGSALN